MEDYLLPWKVSDKLKLRFLSPTLRIGENAEFVGFVVNPSNDEYIRRALWRKLSPLLGDIKVRGMTPFPEDGFPIIPVVFPGWFKRIHSLARIRGKVYDLSQFSNLSGRFILVEAMERVKPENYFLLEKSGLDGRKIYTLMNSAFPAGIREVIFSYFISSSSYLNRVGGCTVNFMDTLSKYYASDFSPIARMIGKVNPLLRKERIKITLMYEEDVEAVIATSFKIKYNEMDSRKALSFYSRRRDRAWEKNAITKSNIKMENLIGISDIPYIATSEEMKIQLDEILEYSFDIALFALEKHLENPSIDETYAQKIKERFIRKIEKEFPLISESMKMGVVMDMADVNGFGEHLARLINAWERAGIGDSFESVYSLYSTVFERIEDVMQDKLRRELAALNEKKRIERVINRILWELNTLKPEGWSFEYFERKMKERGIEDRIERIFEELKREGIVIRKDGRFLAASYL